MGSISGAFTKNKVVEILLAVVAWISILWSVYFSLGIVFTPYQIEFREGTSQVLTGFLLRGHNSFALQNQPLTMNQYGLGYNLVALPFAALFGNTLIVHRLISFVFIALSAVVCFWSVHKKIQDGPGAFACAAFVLVILIAHGGVGAFPAAMGTFLFLLAILFPFLRSFDTPSLLVSAFSAMAAFYTKPYFLLAFGIVASYLFLFVSKRKGLEYGLFFLIPFGLSFVLALHFLPLYFVDIFISNVSNRILSLRHLGLQLMILGFFLGPLIVVFLFNIRRIVFFENSLSTPRRATLLDFRNWHDPLIGRPLGLVPYSLFCSLLAFIFLLGPHEGSFMNYAYQLLGPLFFILFFQQIGMDKRTGPVAVPLILFNLIALTLVVQSPGMLRQKDSSEWARVSEYLNADGMILNSMAVTSQVIDRGQIPTDSGQTSYYYEVEPFQKNLLTAISYESFADNGIRYVNYLDGMIRAQKFDLVITTEGRPSFYHEELLADYYYRADEITVQMPQTGETWTLVFWKPLLK